MLDIKPFIVEEPEDKMTTKLSDYLLFYKLKPAKRTRTLMGIQTFNHLFNKFKGDYYQLFIHNLVDKKLLFKNVNKYNRLEKIKKYYTEGHYENIKEVIIHGENQVTPLLEALALWVDYDLIKDYYKGFDLEKIDKTLWLWSTYHSNYLPNHDWVTKNSLQYNSQDKDLLRMKPRFNLFRFIWLLSRDEIPLVYKDGVLMLDEDVMFKDVNIYNVDSVETAIKNIIKTLLNKNLSLDDFLYGDDWSHIFYIVIHAFPYVFVLGWTGYGYALNVYKFNPKSMGFELVKYFKVERPFIGRKGLKNIQVVNVNDLSDMSDFIIVKFWLDDEYMYFYAYSDGIMYKVKRSDVQFLGVDGRKYYFRMFDKHFNLRIVDFKSFTLMV